MNLEMIHIPAGQYGAPGNEENARAPREHRLELLVKPIALNAKASEHVRLFGSMISQWDDRLVV